MNVSMTVILGIAFIAVCVNLLFAIVCLVIGFLFFRFIYAKSRGGGKHNGNGR